MAIIPSNEPLGSDDELVQYPHGNFAQITGNDNQEVAIPKRLIDDWLGFAATLMAAGGVTPTGNPDVLNGSQLYNALLNVINDDARDIQAYLGIYADLAALDAAHPTPSQGSTATIQSPNLALYYYNGAAWVTTELVLDASVITADNSGNSLSSVTQEATNTEIAGRLDTIENPATIESLYEGQTNTNKFTDAYKSKLDVSIADNTVVVNQSNAIAILGGAIDSTKLYLIDGLVDMGSTSITVPTTGMFIAGLSMDLSCLKSTANSYTLFVDNTPTNGSGSVFIRDLSLEVSGTSSQVFNLEDDTGFNAIEFVNVNFNNCTSLGFISLYRQLLESNTGRFGGSPTLTLVGPMVGGYRIGTSIVRGLSAGMTDPLFKAGVGLTFATRFVADFNVDLPASAALADFAPSNFTSVEGFELVGTRISRNGALNPNDSNILPNISASDNASYWAENVGIDNTNLGGSLEITAEIATSIVATSTFYSLAGTYTAGDLDHMSSPSNGRLRWDGLNASKGRAFLNLDIAGPANDNVTVRVQCDRAAGGTDTLLSLTRAINNLVGGNDLAFFNRTFNVTLEQNDEVYVEVSNGTTTGNLTGKTDSILVFDFT